MGNRPTQVRPTAHYSDRAHGPRQQPRSSTEHRREAVADTDVESRSGGGRQDSVVEPDGNRTFRHERRAHVTGREDRDDPPGADAPFQDGGDDPEHENCQN
jgi:hypothetical protein